MDPTSGPPMYDGLEFMTLEDGVTYAKRYAAYHGFVICKASLKRTADDRPADRQVGILLHSPSLSHLFALASSVFTVWLL